MKNQFKLKVLTTLMLALSATQAQAIAIEGESVKGSFDNTISIGIGVRTKNPSCNDILISPAGVGAPGACTLVSSSLGDQGDLNYKRGDAFTTYLKGTDELLLKFPEGVKFMGRVSWLKDFSSTSTTGYVSAGNPAGVASQTDAAHSQLSFKARLLDFWVSKDMSFGDQNARLRVGNQVVSWGESLFIPGGINQTNAIDYMRLSQPGTQLKEVFLPAPIISFASGLGHGFNFETYVQANWNPSYFPPTGSYWSVVNGLGSGSTAYGLNTQRPGHGNQYGAALRWQPEGTQANIGFYAMNYTDKTPNLSLDPARLGWVYLENRQLYGISANVPVGDWAFGSEVSYRPKDALSLNPDSGCANNNNNCYVDSKKIQAHLTAILSVTPGGNYSGLLNLLGAQTATLMAEAVMIKYPGLKQTYNGDQIGAGAWGWGMQTNPLGVPESAGTSTSGGFNFDFSWVYDGTVVPGWQMIPEVYFFDATTGRTPNIMAPFMQGAKSSNMILTFVKNPATWQFGVNYAKFWGGSNLLDQPYADRDFVGAYASFNF